MIIHDQRLVVVLEFKSQVGSIGKNVNNRAEEALGSCSDLRVAQREGLYQTNNHVASMGDATPSQNLTATLPRDPRPPFAGYLLLLEDSDDTDSGGRNLYPHHYNIDPIFDGTAYIDRYRILCERMMSERLYDAALVLSRPDMGLAHGRHRSVTAATSVENLFLEIAARVRVAARGSNR